jgi:hypothetical protein
LATNREFAAQIMELVLSRLPDHLILEAVGRRLGTPLVRAGKLRPAAGASSKQPSSARRPAAAPRPRATSPERQELLATIERIVRAGTGLSASDVARAARVPQPRVAAALKELKLDGRIFQGGDRRFARYAGDPKVAEQASITARENAPGPILSQKPARAKK